MTRKKLEETFAGMNVRFLNGYSTDPNTVRVEPYGFGTGSDASHQWFLDLCREKNIEVHYKNGKQFALIPIDRPSCLK